MKDLVVVIAAFVVIVAGGLYLSQHVSVPCWDFFGLYKGCAVVTH